MAYFRCMGGNGGGQFVPEISGQFGASSTIKFMNGRYISGFSTGNDTYFPRTPAGNKPSFDFTKPFKIHLRVKASSLITRSQALIGNSQSFYYLPSIEFQSNSVTNFIWGGFSTNGSIWTSGLVISKAELPFVANQWYNIDYEWNGTTYTLRASDGTSTVTKTATTTKYYQTSSGAVQLGTVSSSNDHYAQNVTFDLANCYWEENGVVIWGNKA